MKTKNTKLKELENILHSFNDWGYLYRISDYASSNQAEENYAEEGKRQISELAKTIWSWFESKLKEREEEMSKKALKVWKKEYQFSGHTKGVYGTGFYNGYFTALSELGINPLIKNKKSK